jgi:hypothetical protein
VPRKEGSSGDGTSSPPPGGDDPSGLANLAKELLREQQTAEEGAPAPELVPSKNAYDPAAHALAERIAGQAQMEFTSGPAGNKEFDAVSDVYVAEAKPANQQLGSAWRNQAQLTFKQAIYSGRIPYFQFDGPPGPGVLDALSRYAARYGVEPVIDLNPLGG